MAEHQNFEEQDASKGAVEGDGRARTRRGKSGNTSLNGQNTHRTESNLVKSNDSDFPEPGLSPEHSGNQEFTHEQQGADIENGVARKHPDRSPNREQDNQDPGHRQKENQNQSKDDPLAA